ncbi:MAG: hypothetical protein GY719_19995, partial [bacterium]|nr:hypothetical protein [bacterium]
MKLHRTLTATLIAFCLVGSAAAAAPVAEISTDASGVYFLPLASGSYELRVDGPNGFSHRETFTGSSPSFQLSESVVIDGRYTYELVQIPAEPSEAERAEVALRQPVVQSGTFTVVGGSVADPKQVEAFDKAQVFTTDLITQG